MVPADPCLGYDKCVGRVSTDASPLLTHSNSRAQSVICSSNVAPDVDNSAGVSSAASAKLLTWPELARSPSWTPCTLPVAFGKASPEEAG
eukprot:CAMPEP_0115601486 /NCGR_PEP_ID=MMETSP0272-20121206/15426_1 /TAXON_ID=71861 /ORGANISM="Scrippsiella trochoidea, Strain CCMP3099" /LENGTH=89 /DNA_ID=CAMNT_0003036957 /DNA_START=407 /DNA_END=672 /DNA_ORIENTATION=+